MNLAARHGAALLLALPSACSTPAPIATAAGEIVLGQPSGADEDGVVQLSMPAQKLTCSGALVAPNLVITALHCVSHALSAEPFSCDLEGQVVSPAQGAAKLGGTLPPSDIEVRVGRAPGANRDALGLAVVGSGSTVTCRNDLAFVVLDRELDGPPYALRLGSATPRRESARVIGYGQTEMPSSVGRFARGGVLVTDVGEAGGFPRAGSASPNTLVLGPGACHGDSGGPAISERTGALIGVYSLSAGISCESDLVRNVYTQVAPFESLVEKAFDVAGYEPLLEDVSGGVGGGVSAAGASADSGFAGQPALESISPSTDGCSLTAARTRAGTDWLSAVLLTLAWWRHRDRRSRK